MVGDMGVTGTGDVGSAGAVPRAPRRQSPAGLVLWATGFVTVAVVGLVALDWAALMMHAIGYGFEQVLDPGAVAPPHTDDYVRALVAGALLAIAATCAMLWLLLRTAARQWAAWITALLAAGIGGVVGASALLLVLGISPLSLLTP